MPMGVVSDEDFQKELANSQIEVARPVNATVEPLPKPGRKDGDVNVPESLRKIIGETSVMEGRKSALELAEALGISPSSVSAYSHSATSTATYNEPDSELESHLQTRKSKVANTALTRLSRSLKILTTDKISTATPREVASIAKDMAAVVKMMEPENTGKDNGVKQPQFVVFAPTFRDERTFETIVAKDNF